MAPQPRPAGGDVRRINLVLADPSPLMLSAMSEAFLRDPRFSLVATVPSAETFLSTVMRVPVDVGVVDWGLPVLGGQRLLEVLRDHPAAPRIVIYSEERQGAVPRRALAAGAAGFCCRSGQVDQLLETAASVAAGRMVFPFLDVRDLQQDLTFQLTRREQALLEALAQGKSNKELAQEFAISVNTVKFHLSNLFEKLEVRNRAQAIAYYFSARLDLSRPAAGGSGQAP